MSMLRVGVAGCGHISKAHVDGWRKASGAQVTAVFDLDRSMAERLASQFSVPVVAESFDGLVEDSDVVDICTPPASHFALLRQALAADKNVLIEKPIVTDLAEWRELRPVAEAGTSSLSVVHNLKFTRCARKARRWIEEGRLGRVLRSDWSFLTSPANDRMLVGNEHWSHRLPGGRWFETLPHFLYLTHYLTGALAVESVSAFGSEHAPDGAPAEEVFVVLAGNGSSSTVHFSASCRLNRRWGTIVGTDGLIELDLLGDAACLVRGGDSKAARAVSRLATGAMTTVAQAIPDRLSYFGARLRGVTPHSRIISELARHLHGNGNSPTSLEEIDYVVENSARIGTEIDQRLQLRP